MHLLAVALQDYTQQQQAMAGLGFGIMALAGLIGLAFYAFFTWIFWRIFVKAGMSGALGLLVLIPGIGILVALCILAFGNWNVVAAPAYMATPMPPTYPPQDYPPSNYPPQQGY